MSVRRFTARDAAGAREDGAKAMRIRVKTMREELSIVRRDSVFERTLEAAAR